MQLPKVVFELRRPPIEDCVRAAVAGGAAIRPGLVAAAALLCLVGLLDLATSPSPLQRPSGPRSSDTVHGASR